MTGKRQQQSSRPAGRKADPASKPPSDDFDKLTQREKFIRTARELGCDETGEEFDRAFARAFPPRKPGEPVRSYVEQAPPKGSRRKVPRPNLPKLQGDMSKSLCRQVLGIL